MPQGGWGWREHYKVFSHSPLTICHWSTVVCTLINFQGLNFSAASLLKWRLKLLAPRTATNGGCARHRQEEALLWIAIRAQDCSKQGLHTQAVNDRSRRRALPPQWKPVIVPQAPPGAVALRHHRRARAPPAECHCSWGACGLFYIAIGLWAAFWCVACIKEV